MPIKAITLNSVRKSISASKCADSRGRQRGEDRERMDIALVQNSEHDIDRNECGENQPRLVLQRSLEGLGRALKTSPDAGRQVDLLRGLLDRRHRVAERVARREIERESDGRELSLTADAQAGSWFP